MSKANRVKKVEARIPNPNAAKVFVQWDKEKIPSDLSNEIQIITILWE